MSYILNFYDHLKIHPVFNCVLQWPQEKKNTKTPHNETKSKVMLSIFKDTKKRELL